MRVLTLLDPAGTNVNCLLYICINVFEKHLIEHETARISATRLYKSLIRIVQVELCIGEIEHLLESFKTKA